MAMQPPRKFPQNRTPPWEALIYYWGGVNVKMFFLMFDSGMHNLWAVKDPSAVPNGRGQDKQMGEIKTNAKYNVL